MNPVVIGIIGEVVTIVAVIIFLAKKYGVREK